MPYLQPTVRQLQPLGRRHHSAAVLPEEAAAPAREADTALPSAKASAPRRRRRRYRLPARATLS